MEHKNLYQATLSLPIGKIGIRTSPQCLIGIEYLSHKYPTIKPKNIIAKEAVEQLLCYFADPHYAFDIPLELTVSDFQKNVLAKLQKIPVGATRSYTDIARLLHTSPRPIGNACRTNPIPIVIPCHRVVAEKNLGGYSGEKKGQMLEIKRWLLQHEGAEIP